MKQKFALITLLLISLAQLNSFAQQHLIEIPSALPLVSDDAITGITASDNIDLVLMPERPGNTGAKAPGKILSKLKVSYDDGNLFLSAAKKMSADERLVVYVWVSDLQTLRLDGNARAISSGILPTKFLHISASGNAFVSLKSKSKVWFDEPAKYNVKTEKDYFMVNAL